MYDDNIQVFHRPLSSNRFHFSHLLFLFLLDFSTPSPCLCFGVLECVWPPEARKLIIFDKLALSRFLLGILKMFSMGLTANLAGPGRTSEARVFSAELSKVTRSVGSNRTF